MAFYLVTAKPKQELLPELEKKLANKEFVPLEPFGSEVNKALTWSRRKDKDTAIWEENNFCIPPLAQEREAVLDKYFDKIEVEKVAKGEGWDKISELPFLFPDLERSDKIEGY